MNSKKFIVCLLITSCMAALAFRFKPVATFTKDRPLFMADTSSFVPGKASGWDVISSYLNQDTQDSVEFELLLKQNNLISWNSNQFIGAIINKAFKPKNVQKVNYDLFRDNTWAIRIATNGQCFLTQLKGEPLKASALPGGPFVVPVKVRYKNN